MRWTKDDVSVEIDNSLTADPVVTVVFQTPIGHVTVMAELIVRNNHALAGRLHIHGTSFEPGELGISGLRALAFRAMEILDVSSIQIDGARRTTGANPGNTPRPIRFTRPAASREGS